MSKPRGERQRGAVEELAAALGGAEKLAQAIREVSASAKALRQAGLTDRALIVLLAHISGQRQRAVREVLRAAADLDRWALGRRG